MDYIKKQLLHERKIRDTQLVIDNNGNIVLSPNSKNITIKGNLLITDSPNNLTQIDHNLLVLGSLNANELVLDNPLDVPTGGTGNVSFNINTVLFGNNDGAISTTAAAGDSDIVFSNQILTVDENNVPVWTDTIDGGIWDED